jgi:hypothetical protein
MSRVENRLKLLSPKVGIPFQKLLAAGQLNEQVVETVLDAGELAGDTSKLVAFTAGMMYLQSQGVPVHDVIDMAKKQGRRINLGWSGNRWKEEHSRLSQAETLRRLAQENVTYDVSKFSAYLPKCFPGYLIRSSRRLGMEGLRQRHCIANYHDQLLAGHCAIACVFVRKQRWTVQLAVTGNKEVPLRIVQIKTRFNGTPSNDVSIHIHSALQIKQVKASTEYETEHTPAERTYIENLRRVLPVLRDLGLMQVTVRFDGSGDSGSIDKAEFEPAIKPAGITVPVRRATREFIQGDWRYAYSVEQVSLDAAINDIAHDYLDETGVDWYNNDGGYGDLVIDVAQGTVALAVNVRTSDSHTEYAATKDIETGEVL